MKTRSLIQNKFTLSYLRPILSFAQSKAKPILIDFSSFLNYYVLRKKPKLNFTPPKILYINVSSYCNAKCCFCGYRKIKDKPSLMSFELFKKTVDEFVLLGGEEINFTPTIGDALIDPGLFEKISYCKKLKLKVSFYTNGILLKKNNNYKKIVDTGVDSVLISLADINPGFESKVFDIPINDAKQKIEGIAALADYVKKKKSTLPITLGFRAMRPFKKIYADLKRSKLKKNIDQLYFEYVHAYDNWGGMISQKDLRGVQKTKRYLRVRKYPCKVLFTVSVLPNGDVRMCGCRVKDTLYDELVIGNINKSSLKNILSSKKRLSLIKNFCTGKMPEVCRRCTFYAPKY